MIKIPEEKLRELWIDKCWSAQMIADEFDIGRTEVYYWLNNWGIKRKCQR